jgi:hypothetical protein
MLAINTTSACSVSALRTHHFLPKVTQQSWTYDYT